MTNHPNSTEQNSAAPLEMGEPSYPAALDPFHNGEGIPFVDMWVDGHRETHKVSSETFRQRLFLRSGERDGVAPAASKLKAQIEQARATALHPNSPERKVCIRVACVDGHIYIDLADADWNVVDVGPDGWKVIKDPPVRFIRTPGMVPLPTPQAGGSIASLKALVNVNDEDDFVLLIAWVLNALRNEAQHPVLVLTGGEGTAKSTLINILRSLIDPGCIPFKGLPRSETEFTRLFGERYLQGFDNVSDLSRNLSDALCRYSTGGNARPIIINGIGDVVKRLDLADRCIFIPCEVIPEGARRSEVELWSDFEEARPQLFGLLLDALSHGLKHLPETQPQNLPRMADFALWATACEGALWTPGTFTAAYGGSISETVEKMIAADLVASAVRQLMVKRPTWTGTASELDGHLRVITGLVGTTPPGWPSDPARLGRRLRELAPSLSKVGIVVAFTKTGRNRSRDITISARTVPQSPSTDAAGTDVDAIRSSPPSATSAVSEPLAGAGGADGADGSEPLSTTGALPSPSRRGHFRPRTPVHNHGVATADARSERNGGTDQ